VAVRRKTRFPSSGMLTHRSLRRDAMHCRLRVQHVRKSKVPPAATEVDFFQVGVQVEFSVRSDGNRRLGSGFAVTLKVEGRFYLKHGHGQPGLAVPVALDRRPKQQPAPA
jgi:hypothetical protein